MSSAAELWASPGPLSGVRVIDLTHGAAAAVGRYLAELGAEVAKIETPWNQSDRKAGVTIAGISLEFAAANLGKRGLSLDLSDPGDVRQFHALADCADILLESSQPGSEQADLIGLSGLRQRNARLVTASITDFGPGAYQGWVATDPVLAALNGLLARSGMPGRAPLLPPGNLNVQCALAQGTYGVLVAYLHRLQTGRGDHLDLSLLDGSAIALDPGFGIGGSASAGKPASQSGRGRPRAAHLYPVLPCQDGFARLCILAKRQWRGLFEWMGRPAQFADPDFDDLRHRYASEELQLAIATFIAGKTREQIEVQSQQYGVPAAAVLTLDEVLETRHVAERQVFCEVEVAPGIAVPLPDGMLVIDGKRAGPPQCLPGRELTAEALVAEWAPRPYAPTIQSFGRPGMPFTGLRVLDLGVIVVGAEQGRLLADYGADVIKIESPDFPDGMRANSPGGMSPGFAAGHRNKRSLALNLRTEPGRAIFLSLVERADIVLSNFKPGTMDALGLSENMLLEHNPKLITVESSAFGDSGPWCKRMGYGPLVRASAGLSDLWRYADDPASYADTVTVYPDHVAARIAIAGVIAGLIRRVRTGSGCQISISQMEVMLAQMAPMIARKTLDRRGVALCGHEIVDTPWDVFSCAGDDEWCAITVRDDRDWRALCSAIGLDDLLADPDLADRSGRANARERINEAVRQWTSQHPPARVMNILQKAGVPAGMMLRVGQLPQWDYFREQFLFREMHQPGETEPVMVDAVPIRSLRLAETPLRPAPQMGQHSADVLHEVLNFSAEDIAHLIDSGIVTT